jgi:hypothetical protein
MALTNAEHWFRNQAEGRGLKVLPPHGAWVTEATDMRVLLLLIIRRKSGNLFIPQCNPFLYLIITFLFNIARHIQL